MPLNKYLMNTYRFSTLVVVAFLWAGSTRLWATPAKQTAQPIAQTMATDSSETGNAAKLNTRPEPIEEIAAVLPDIQDSDGDGLEDSLERTLGTDLHNKDTDGDGLTDYDEYCKDHTDPTKNDSDGDGIPDGDWIERREYTYTIRAICDIRPPNNVGLMTDVYQDARVIKRPGRLKDSMAVELIIYPFATPHIVAKPYPFKELPEGLQIYTNRTVAFNYSEEMQREVRAIVKEAKTDVEAVGRILKWIAQETRLANDTPEFAYFHVENNQLVWRQPMGGREEQERLLQSNFYGDSMFKQRIHGTCSSLATLRTTILRAAGIPARLIQTLPLFNRYENDPEPLVDGLRRRIFARGYQWGVGGGGANHVYNEVFLGSQWVRVDQVIGTGPFIGDKLFVQVYSAADWNDLYYPRPAEEISNENRDFRTLEVTDAEPKHTAPDSPACDIAIGDGGLMVYPQPDGRFEASVLILNKGNAPSPSFSVRFYAGDPDKGGRLVSPNAAGPIMPRSTWQEGTHPFSFKEGENELFVLIDAENILKRPDRTKLQASRVVTQGPSQSMADNKHTRQNLVGSEVVVGDEGLIVRTLSRGRFEATVLILNKGTTPSPNFSVRFYAGNPEQGGRLISNNAAGPIPLGSQWREGTLPFSLKEGESEVFVLIDAENVGQRPDKTKRLIISTPIEGPSTSSVPRSPSSYSGDLRIDSQSISSTLLNDGKRYLLATIHNRGERTPPVEVRFFLGDPDHGGKVIGQGALVIEANQQGSELIPWECSPGEYEVFVIVDPDNKIHEENKENNRASQRLTIKEQSVVIHGNKSKPP